MAAASVDPAELRRFAHDLNKFNVELQQLVGSINIKLRALEQTWRDNEQRKFSEAFGTTSRMISQFLDASTEHAGSLNKKAALIEEYLKQR